MYSTHTYFLTILPEEYLQKEWSSQAGPVLPPQLHKRSRQHAHFGSIPRSNTLWHSPGKACSFSRRPGFKRPLQQFSLQTYSDLSCCLLLRTKLSIEPEYREYCSAVIKYFNLIIYVCKKVCIYVRTVCGPPESCFKNNPISGELSL